MPWFARDGGTWRSIVDPKARVSGVWQPISNGWVRISGVWQRFYQRTVVAITNRTIASVGLANPASVSYALTSAGAVEQTINGGGGATVIENWITPQSGMSGYEGRVTATGSGGTFTGTTGSWLSLGTTRTWALSSTSAGLFCDRELTVEIRDATTLAVLATAVVTLQVEAT